MRSLGAILLLCAALALAACGGDDGGGDGPSAGEYTNDACTAAGNWVRSIQRRAASLRTTLGPNATPQQGRTALQGFLDGAISDTDKFARDLDAAGVPDVEGGEDAAQELRTAADSAKGVLQQARAQADQLPVNDPQRFGTEARQLGSSARESLGRVGDAIATPRSEELRKAREESRACKQLRS